MDVSKIPVTGAELRALPAQWYPLFDCCHIALCVLAVRKEAGRQFGWNHPLATWASCVVSSFAGSLLANPLLGKPMFGAFSDEKMLAFCTLAFVCMFYAPGDLVYKLITFKPIYLIICTIKEIFRGKKIWYGLADGAKAFPNSPYFIPVVVAVIKGNGSAFMNPFSQCVRGVWEPMKTELMKPSVTTKLCAVAAILFHTFNQPQHDIIYISFTGLFLSVKLASIFGQSVNPLAPMETIFWGFLGAFQESGDETTAAHKKSD